MVRRGSVAGESFPCPDADSSALLPDMKFPRKSGLLSGWLGCVLFASLRGADPAPPQGAALLKTDVLGVFAHPDDETGIAPLVADLALRQGRRVAHVYCTRGEGGGNMVGTQYGPSLGVLREAELRNCLQVLGVRFTYFLDREDFAYTESLAVTLEKWGHDDSLRRLVRLVRALRPEVMVTMNPAPTPGQHGNHQAAGWLAVEAFEAAADARVFPEQITHEGLSTWQTRKLYFGGNGPYMATLATTNALPDGRVPAHVAAQALAHHRSQAFGNFGNSPWFLRPQRLQLVKSVVPFEADETDLFRGLPLVGEPAAIRPVSPPRTSESDADSEGESFFQPRPAVARYREFVRRNGIEHAAASFTPDVPVVAGMTNEIALQVPPGVELAGIQWEWPPGWSPVGIRRPEAGRVNSLAWVRVGVPAGARGDYQVKAAPPTVGRGFPASARLHVVPRFVAPLAAGLLKLDREARWEEATAQFTISHTNLWEGKTRDAADNQAVVRIAHQAETLFVEVAVTDDVVVSNIAPDDIKGHWRSDSVELCFDPKPGSEHTLACYKLGIFPFDSTGKVRAARDADARPGGIEETAPGTHLTSWRTADGYVIRAAIPLAEIGITPGRNRELGFNVLIYDGDKTNAVPGENINKSRLAWTPRGGVQGRPEDWGRLILK